MTELRTTQGVSVADTGRDVRAAGELEMPQHTRPSSINVGLAERAASVVAGALLATLGITQRSRPGILLAALGGAMLFRGAAGRCPLYRALDINTADDTAEAASETLARRGIDISETFLINRPPNDLYNYWRNLENLPSIMTHLKRVQVLDDRRSRWVAHAPRIAGGAVEWEAEITCDDPNKAIAWRSLPGADVDNAGEVRFTPAPGERGTEAHVRMSYLPPAGKMGHWIARLFGSDAEHQVREDLRNFKRIMEIGEVLTTEGQPRGACLRLGRRNAD